MPLVHQAGSTMSWILAVVKVVLHDSLSNTDMTPMQVS